MNLAVRLFLVAGGGALLLMRADVPSDVRELALGAGAATVGLAGLVAAQHDRFRPFSDGLAWAGVAAALTVLEGWDLTSLPATLLIVGVVVVLSIGFHIPAAGAPKMRLRTTAVNWAIVGILAGLVACIPLLWPRDDIVVLDPLTSPGLALRMVAAAALLAGVAALWGLSRGQDGLASETAPDAK